MESNNDPIDQVSEKLSLNTQNRSHLKSAAGWGNFLAIIAFIFVGLMVIAALAVGTLLTAFGGMSEEELPFPPAAISVVYLVLGLVYFFPALFLYRFSTKMKSALHGNQQTELDSSLSNLKALLQFLGVLTIIGLILYGVGIVAGILFAGTLASFVS